MSISKKAHAKSSLSFFSRVGVGLVVFCTIAIIVYFSYPSSSFEYASPIVLGHNDPFFQNSSFVSSLRSHGKVENPAMKSDELKKNHNSDTLADPTIINQIRTLRDRAAGFLNWVTKDARSSPPFLRWDLVSNADVHIVHNLVRYIDFFLEDPSKQKELESIYRFGYQCSSLDAMRQELISKYISMDICSEVEWYKVLHLAWPDARTFLDVGANKGYLGSLFLTLWGGGSFQSSPAELYEVATKLQAWKTSRNPKGYCKDGDHFGIPMYCPPNEKRDPDSGKCLVANSDVRIYSLDGSSYLAETLTSIISHFPTISHPHSNATMAASQVWSYRNFAVSDHEGKAYFTKQSKEKNPGFEGGGIRSSSTTNSQSNVGGTNHDNEEEVPMITVDRFAQIHNLSNVDILKIDTEGNDNKVLRGGKEILSSSVGMFAFEGGKGVSFSKQMITALDSVGFSCYSTSRAGLYKWNGQCMKERYMGGFAAKDKGNIFCISRLRAPLAAFAFDVLTFPAAINFLLNDKWYSRQSDRAKEEIRNLGTAFGNSTASDGSDFRTGELPKVDPASMMPVYINIHKFCKPWPTCAQLGD